MMECDNTYVYSGGNSTQAGWFIHQNSAQPQKRRREENGCFLQTNGTNGSIEAKSNAAQHSSFIQILPNKGIFQSEDWKPNGSTLYHPVCKHLLVNFEKYDQISFDEGLFFIGDSSGGCLQKEQGHVIHCWRFDEKAKTLYIALSFLFTNLCMYQEVFSHLICA
ncbi:hypothetical protein GDO86_000956 [Hymenochirus boettgeri]|uniref:Uncharacterized protein n=1 Tax=Hymenochirus boettgeri TaxID=247094 RepID=A0A8T2KG43_9PIPI|nr:hypothetical protein GDO86_000956 [Hymenochirus boettgeri]